MKKTITSALLTLALVGFANAAPPAATKPESVPVKVETVDSLKAEVKALKKENESLKLKNLNLRKLLNPRLVTHPNKDPRGATRKDLQQAYVKMFDLNKDGKVSLKEIPNRKQQNEFLSRFQRDNYPQNQIPLSQRGQTRQNKSK